MAVPHFLHTRWWLRLCTLIGVASLFLLHWASPVFSYRVIDTKTTEHLVHSQPFDTRINHGRPATVHLVFDYKRGQNPVITIGIFNDYTIDYIVHISHSTGKSAPLHMVDQTWSAGSKKFDLSPYVKEGPNEINITLSGNDWHVPVYISSVWFGEHWPSTLACMGLFLMAAAWLLVIARALGLDDGAAIILALGMGYFALWLHIWPDLRYTNDLDGHLAYLRYMSDRWNHPYGYAWKESFHPPLYYFFAGMAYKLASTTGLLHPLLAVRMFSLLLYLTFCCYGLRTLREAITRENLPYYIGCLLVVFWPSSILFATRINNDIALATVWAAAFYYLARGHRERSTTDLYLAITLTGLAFMIKSTAFIIAAIVGSVILCVLLSGRIAWRSLKSKGFTLSVLLLLLGITVSFGRLIYTSFDPDAAQTHFGGARHDPADLHHFLTFSAAQFVREPFITFYSEPGFLNYFLKTMLYGQFSWRTFAFVSWWPQAINVTLLAFLVMTFWGSIVAVYEKRWREDQLPHLLAIFWSIAALAVLMVLKQWIVGQEFRFVAPMLIPLVILFVRGMETARTIHFYRPLYALCAIIGFALPLMAAVLYLGRLLN